MKHSHTSDAALRDLPPADEIGTPDSEIERCACGVLFRVGGEHRCENRGEWVSWEEYTHD